MAYVLMFRAGDLVRLSQSPTGGGEGNLAWDFQWFVSSYQVDKAYGFEMRLAYVPCEGSEQIQKLHGERSRRWQEKNNVHD